MCLFPYTEIETKSVTEFFEKLNPLNAASIARRRIYRGQENSEWPLIASLFRKFGKEISRIDPHEIVSLEILALDIFAQTLGKINLFDQRCENVTKWKRDFLNIKSKEMLEEWPNQDALELMALAQHSGLPTRLLDWTYNPYIAAHFAAHTLLLNETKSEKLAVWCCDNSYTIDSRTGVKSGDHVTNVYRLDPPFLGSNPNAVAQSGCFLFLKEIKSEKSYNIDDQLIINTEKEKNNLFKITVPSSAAKDIIHLCELFGVTRSNLFRTYEGCAEEVKERLEYVISKIRAH